MKVSISIDKNEIITKIKHFVKPPSHKYYNSPCISNRIAGHYEPFSLPPMPTHFSHRTSRSRSTKSNARRTCTVYPLKKPLPSETKSRADSNLRRGNQKPDARRNREREKTDPLLYSEREGQGEQSRGKGEDRDINDYEGIHFLLAIIRSRSPQGPL